MLYYHRRQEELKVRATDGFREPRQNLTPCLTAGAGEAGAHGWGHFYWLSLSRAARAAGRPSLQRWAPEVPCSREGGEPGARLWGLLSLCCKTLSQNAFLSKTNLFAEIGRK